MNRKLAACILSLIIGVTVTTNANALACNIFTNVVKEVCVKVCEKIPDRGVWSVVRQGCI
ncbi:hypothetical protein [Xenorhabdus miraniensis]|uniref:Uncharacterized protein n=1 Tax=Xenorhabdus miraniensis TaxID=351674 RepID=A0A2D0JM48_9GAMM|nr:hypothetical protein [Xenorhabdus miraniensis]PHM47369.1 hypothetical protein Xmir_03270 [Xenorhabdus miraniensis]